MKHFLQFLLFFSLLISHAQSGSSLTADDILISIKNLSPNGTAKFEIVIPEGWKFAKPPEITSKYKRSKFNYQENLEKISERTYRTSCRLNKDREDVLKFYFFLCKDYCAIISKDFSYTPDNSVNLILIMILFGLAGGLLLNVMPCVLPVILLKIKHMNSRETITNSIVGNYLAFAILASVLSLLKISGETVGWGFHFQNLYFLKFVAIFFFVITLMSFDLIRFYWHLNLDKFKVNNKFVKDVLYSIITTMVAIPCTAPLLGTAATFALQKSIPNLFLIFTAIATGFSFPLFVVLFSKFSLENFFKQPIINKLINFGVVLTFGWICWILFKTLYWTETLIIFIIFIGATLSFVKNKNKLAFLLLSVIMFLNFPQDQSKTVNRFSEVSELVKQNNIVILNVTADWCLSCKYNELALKSDQVKSHILKNKVKFIEIDVTQQNDQVMDFITKHSRSGIPFTIIYGPKNKSGILLSEIPSTSEIIKTIDLVK